MNSKTAVQSGFWAVMLLVITAPQALALTSPGAGSFAYDIYDITVNKMVKGPIGFTAGIFAIAIGGIMLVQGKALMAIAPVLGGAILIKADTIVQSLGAQF